MIVEDKRKYAAVECLNRLIKEKPCQEITVSEICAEASISKATFYKWFKSKEDAFSYLYLFTNIAIMDALPVILIADAPMLQKYWSILAFFPRRSVEMGHEAVAYIMQQGYKAEEHPFYKGEEMYRPFAESMLALAQKNEEIRTDLSTHQLHQLINITLVGLTMMWSCNAGSFDLVQEMYDAMLAVFCAKPAFTSQDVLGPITQ